jgi:hypothetical protein
MEMNERDKEEDMSTRSRIGIECKDGQVISVYCHSDGYPSEVGDQLLRYWGNAERAATLVALGDINYLEGDDLAPSGKRGPGTTTYNRWRNEGTSAHTMANRDEYLTTSAEYSGAEYVYLYGPRGWEFSPAYRGKQRWQPLTREVIVNGED